MAPRIDVDQEEAHEVVAPVDGTTERPVGAATGRRRRVATRAVHGRVVDEVQRPVGGATVTLLALPAVPGWNPGAVRLNDAWRAVGAAPIERRPALNAAATQGKSIVELATTVSAGDGSFAFEAAHFEVAACPGGTNFYICGREANWRDLAGGVHVSEHQAVAWNDHSQALVLERIVLKRVTPAIVSVRSDQPCAGATVLVSRPAWLALLVTGADGVARFDVDGGAADIEVSKDGFGSVSARATPEREGEPARADVVLVPEGLIEGCVLGPDERPLAGIVVSADIDAGRTARKTTTDADGHFEFRGAAPGVNVTVRADPVDATHVSTPTTVTTPATRLRLKLGVGGTLPLEYLLPTTVSGTPLVQLKRVDGPAPLDWHFPSSRVNGTGRVVLEHVAQGRHLVCAQLRGFAPALAEVRVDANLESAPLVLSFVPVRRVSGRVARPDGSPISAFVNLRLGDAQFGDLTLGRREDRVVSFEFQVRTAGDGSYELDVPPGDVVLVAWTGREEILSGEVRVDAADRVAPVIVVEASGARPWRSR